jgi:Mg/Co/Ni transporter MgtE
MAYAVCTALVSEIACEVCAALLSEMEFQVCTILLSEMACEVCTALLSEMACEVCTALLNEMAKKERILNKKKLQYIPTCGTYNPIHLQSITPTLEIYNIL